MSVLEIMDLSQIGYREITMTQELLKAHMLSRMSKAAREGLDDKDGLKIMFNDKSGSVFISDEEYNTYVLYNGQIQKFVVCEECGAEKVEQQFHKVSNDGCERCKELTREYENMEYIDYNEKERYLLEDTINNIKRLSKFHH